MTLIAVASLKRAPGVTTLCCLVGATWPPEQRVIVAEADISGGDLAARFGLSIRRGRATFAAAARRGSPSDTVVDHVQALPGGLQVLTGSAIDTGGTDAGRTAAVTSHALRTLADDVDLIVDMGRLFPESDIQERLLAVADRVVILTEPDTASVIHAREWWVRRCRRPIDRVDGAASSADRELGPHDESDASGRVGLVIVGKGDRSPNEIEGFVGLPVLATVPWDPVGAALACGVPGKARRLRRSPLVSAARRLAATLQVAPEGARTVVPAVMEGTPAAEREGPPEGNARRVGADVSIAAGQSIAGAHGDRPS